MIRCAKESPFTLELDLLSQDTAAERDIFSFCCVLPEFVWSNIAASLLEAFSEIAMAVGVRLDSLEEQEAADKVQPPASGTAARMETAPERFPLINKSLLFLHLGSVHGGRTGSQIFCISFQEVNIDI